MRDGLAPARLCLAVEAVQRRRDCHPQQRGLDEGAVGEEHAACMQPNLLMLLRHHFCNPFLGVTLLPGRVHDKGPDRPDENSGVMALGVGSWCNLPVKSSKMKSVQTMCEKTWSHRRPPLS